MLRRPPPENNYGDEGDYCPACGTDWKAPHREGCSQIRCMYPPGCWADCTDHPNLCPEHLAALSAFFAPA